MSWSIDYYFYKHKSGTSLVEIKKKKCLFILDISLVCYNPRELVFVRSWITSCTMLYIRSGILLQTHLQCTYCQPKDKATPTKATKLDTYAHYLYIT